MYKLTALALFGLLAKQSLAQSAPSDTAVYRQGVQAAMSTYYESIGVQAPLYNGVEHMRYLPTIAGIPYYKVDEWQNGTIEYGGVVYSNVPLKYDMVKDQVVVKHPNGFSSFQLFSPRVSYFILGDERFVYVPAGGDTSVLAPGFYQQLRTGPVTVLARRTKWIEEKIVDAKLERKFLSRNTYYLLKDGVYHSPRKEAHLLALAGNRRQEARQALRQAGTRFRKAPEQAILIVADYINQ